MTDLRTAAQQALKYMKSVGQTDMYPEEWAIVGRLEAALAKPVQEPVAIVGTREGTWKGYEGQWLPPGPPIKTVHMLRDLPQGTPLYTAPSQRKPLTNEEIAEMWVGIFYDTPSSGVHVDGLVPHRFARAIERSHGIGVEK